MINQFLFWALLFSVTFFMPMDTSAQEKKESSKASKVKIIPTALYSQRRVFRGALIWDAPILLVAPGFVFYDQVTFGQGGISYFKNFLPNHTATIGINAFDDNEPNGPVISLAKEKEDYKNQRKATHLTYIKYDYKYQRDFSLSVYYERDLGRHFGDYTFIKASNSSLIPFISFGAAVGIGSKTSNQYAYGPTAESGVGHIDYFVGSFLPILPAKGRLILNLNFSTITDKQNYQGDFVRNKRHQNNFLAVCLWAI